MLQNANQRYRSCEIKSIAGVKEQLVRLKGKEQLKVMVARPQRRAWTPTKRHHSTGTLPLLLNFLSTSVSQGRGGVKNMCDLALKETCQPFNLLSNVDIDVISRTEHFRSIEGAQCPFLVTMVVLW